MTELLLATTNPGKQAEFRRLLAGLGWPVLDPGQLGLALDIVEPHRSYARNAADKAAAYCRASGRPTLADDSGIEVAALKWGPATRTARFGGAGVTDKAGYLLERMRGVADRRARMVCWLALAVPDATRGEPHIELFSGVMSGTVAGAKRGSGGFGYDPVFELPSGMTAAELPDAEKDRLSHRGQAVTAATPRLRGLLEEG